MATEKKEKLDAQIKSADMSEEMQNQAIEVASEAMEKFSIEKDIAQYIKKEIAVYHIERSDPSTLWRAREKMADYRFA